MSAAPAPTRHWREPLASLRHSIDNIDAALIHLLAERFKCTQKVGALKAEFGLPPADPAREAAQIARLRALAHDADLDPQFAETFLGFIVAEVIRHHEAAGAARPSRLAARAPQDEELGDEELGEAAPASPHPEGPASAGLEGRPPERPE